MRLDASIDVEPWTLHDLRRTAAAGMARLGIAPLGVERILVAGIYNQLGDLPEMKEALGRWA